MAKRVKLLAFDTSTNACSVAVLDSDREGRSFMLSKSEIKPMQQGRLILPIIEAILHESNIKLKELDAISFGQGPGSYTGLRIAASVAQGLGLTLDCRIIPISSLAATAQAALLKYHSDSVMVAIDARAQEVYWGNYSNDGQGKMELIGYEQVTAPQQIMTPFTNEWIGIGNAWIPYADILNNLFQNKPKAVYSDELDIANAMLFLAKDKWERREWVEPNKALPVYLR